MTWNALDPAINKNKSAVADMLIAASANGANGRFQPWFQLMFRPALIGAWFLEVGQMVSVELGTDIDSGRLRIAPNGTFPLKKSGGYGRGDGGTSILRLAALPGQSKEAFSATRVLYELDEEALIIDLPRWACLDPTEKKLPNGQPAPPTPAGKPFKLGAPSHADVTKQRQNGG
jgi:hypothetical protein